LTKAGDFRVRVRLSGMRTRLHFQAVDPFGVIENQQVLLEFSEWARATFTGVVALTDGSNADAYHAHATYAESGAAASFTQVTLSENPTTNLQACTKQYADTTIGGKTALDLSGISNGQSLRWNSAANGGLGAWEAFTPPAALSLGTSAGTAMNAGAVPNCTGGQKLQMSVGPVFAWSCVADQGLTSVATANIQDGAVSAAKLGADVGAWAADGSNIYRNAGNVGIGTTAPGYKLEVNGNARVSGQSYIGSDVFVSGKIFLGWGGASTISTDFNCSTPFTLTSIRDGGTYTLVVTDPGTTQCDFLTDTAGTESATVTYRFKPANAARTALSHTIYSLMRVGSIIYVSWGSGF